MLIIGLTGGIGSGKTTVSAMFAKHGIPIIDADHIARELTNTDPTLTKTIVDRYPNAKLIHADKFDRAALRDIIFNQPEEKAWLEQLLHPRIRQQIEERIGLYSNHPYIIVVIPLLFEVTPYSFIDRILVVDTPEHLQVQRVKERDESDETLIKKIMASQVPRHERLSKAEDIIVNDHDLAHLKKQVDDLHKLYVSLADPEF